MGLLKSIGKRHSSVISFAVAVCFIDSYRYAHGIRIDEWYKCLYQPLAAVIIIAWVEFRRVSAEDDPA